MIKIEGAWNRLGHLYGKKTSIYFRNFDSMKHHPKRINLVSGRKTY